MEQVRTRSFHDRVTGTTPFFRVLNGVVVAFVALATGAPIAGVRRAR